MFSATKDSLFILPVCYHPTTILHVDDDTLFLESLAIELSDKLSILCFNNPEKAREHTIHHHHYYPFTDRCLSKEGDTITFNLMAIRNEIYNPDRFKEISINVTDYDMPHTTGIELIKTMEFQPEIAQYSHIILTGKISDEFKEKIVLLGANGEYIGKDDPNYIKKLLTLIEKRLTKIFQWYSYSPARLLSKNDTEKSSFLFDGNFTPAFNSHIKEHNICEFYLFDKQGSYLFLDDEANLSWLFVRNETGIQNTIKLATHYGAPKTVIDALKTKDVILSLYEKEDFEQRKTIEWDKYLIPATVFESNDRYLSFFADLIHENDMNPKYYYAFSDAFPDHGIDKEKILSYQTFLREAD